MPDLNQQMRLADGRNLGYNEYGPANGMPLFYFHGTPSSRVEFPLFVNEALLQSLNIRVIAPDRPGSGLSDNQPNRRITDWSKDIIALADHLKIDRFAVLGYSGGGVYAVVCAHSIPERITKAGVVSGTAPFTHPGLTDTIPADNLRFFAFSYEKPWLSHLFLNMMGAMTRLAPKQVIANALSTLPEPDRKMMEADPVFQMGFLGIIQEALRKGPRGAQHDTRLMVTDWDFNPQEIQIPVYWWHGEEDKNAPIAMGRYMAKTIPNAKAKFYINEGHLSLFKKNAEDILRSLLN